MGDFDNYAMYAIKDDTWIACVQIDPYSVACGICGQSYFRNQPKFCMQCGAEFRTRNQGMPSKEEIYKMETLRDRIAEMERRDPSKTYPAYDNIINTFEEAAARERERVRYQEEMFFRAKQEMMVAIQQRQAQIAEAQRWEPSEIQRILMQQAANLLSPPAISKQIEKPQEIEVINPAQQQPRKILI